MSSKRVQRKRRDLGVYEPYILYRKEATIHNAKQLEEQHLQQQTKNPRAAIGKSSILHWIGGEE